MPRRVPAAITFLLLLLAPLPARAFDMGPPALNLSTFREDDRSYLSLSYSTDRVDMKERRPGLFSAPGAREVERQAAVFSMAWLVSDRLEAGLRLGVQGLRVGNGVMVEGNVIDGQSRLSGLIGAGFRAVAYAAPASSLTVGVVGDVDGAVFRWNGQRSTVFDGAGDPVEAGLRYGEFLEARLGVPASVSFPIAPREESRAVIQKGLFTGGWADSPFPDVTAVELYGGPFARFAYMYGDVRVSSAGSGTEEYRFHLVPESVAGLFGGVRAYCGRGHRYRMGLEGRYQSALSFSLVLDASL